MNNIEKKGIINFIGSEEKFFPDTDMTSPMSYFAPCINPFSSAYQPASSFSIGDSLIAKFDIDLVNRPDTPRKIYSPEYCKFGSNFIGTILFDYINNFSNEDRYDNAELLLDYLYKNNSDAVVSDKFLDMLKAPVFTLTNIPLEFEYELLDKNPVKKNIYGLKVNKIVPPDSGLQFTQTDGVEKKKYVPKLLRVDIPQDEITQSSTRFSLSSDPEKASRGIFEGEINLKLHCRKEEYYTIVMENEAGVSYIEYQLKGYSHIYVTCTAYVESQGSFFVHRPDVAEVFSFNEGNIKSTLLYGSRFENGANLLNINYFCERDEENNLTRLMYQCSNMMSGQAKRNVYSVFVNEIWENDTLINAEYYASPTFASESMTDSYFDNKNNPDEFSNFVRQMGSFATSFGVKNYGSDYLINGYNLNIYDTELYLLPMRYHAAGDNNYYTFNDGLYTALVDHLNNDLFLILNDGQGYFHANISNLLPDGFRLINFIQLPNYEFIIGTERMSGASLNKYFKYKYELIADKIKPDRITYNFNRIALTFIPCHTHCMGKGGITSKV